MGRIIQRNPMKMITDSDSKYIPPASVWSDGGLLTRNPSAIGGTWAWIRVTPELTMECMESGLVLPKHLRKDKVTVQHSELTAIYRALKALPDGWIGELYTDSECMIKWMTQIDRGIYRAWANCPDWFQAWVEAEHRRIVTSGGKIDFLHVHGHNDGSVFHQFNCACDAMCLEEKERYYLANPTVGPASGDAEKGRKPRRKRTEAAKDGSEAM